MDRFFSKLQPDKLMLRNNYFFQVLYELPPEGSPARDPDPHEISWSASSLGGEGESDRVRSLFPIMLTGNLTPDAFNAGHGLGDQPNSSAPYRPSTYQPKVEDIYFRTERQTLRRLPRSGGVLFTIRTYHDPVVRLAQEPGVPGRMASALRSWPEDVAL